MDSYPNRLRGLQCRHLWPWEALRMHTGGDNSPLVLCPVDYAIPISIHLLEAWGCGWVPPGGHRCLLHW